MSLPLLASLSGETPLDAERFGGKASALARLLQRGYPVPTGAAISADVYDRYIDETGLRGRISFELGRKRFEDMRWEELWDAALRMHNLFLRTPVPEALGTPLLAGVHTYCGDDALAIRSSALAEDTADQSFAGLHESFINIRGDEAILQHIRLVWASLWSDRALLYRRELGLDVGSSGMGVVVQRFLAGRCSGVLFTRSPTRRSCMAVEAVPGLNQGLVDGVVEPDRWLVDAATGTVVDQTPGARDTAVVAATAGTKTEAWQSPAPSSMLLSNEEVDQLVALGRELETAFGEGQDVEWTRHEQAFTLLQVRPITTAAADDPDTQRSWYLSLHRSFANLRALRKRIENECLPAIEAEADRFSAADVTALPDNELAEELQRRRARVDHWTQVYWDEFIPFAHGMRLFGHVYNEKLAPYDPYEFMELLKGAELRSLQRNRNLTTLAASVRAEPELAQALESTGSAPDHPKFEEELDAFLERLGRESTVAVAPRTEVVQLVLKMAEAAPVEGARLAVPETSRDERERRFIEAFPDDEREFATDLLDLARASYRLRDDDNVVLAQLETELRRARDESRKRLVQRVSAESLESVPDADLAKLLLNPTDELTAQVARTEPGDGEGSSPDPGARPRQRVGQPASPGIATGRAHVVRQEADLFALERGDILVCDSIDPAVTFVVPLTAAIVERRGGMLIHGAIIAREYGIPCVTGVPDAVETIPDGARITVDGYLGLVTVRS